ncbi:MAG TPA: hypothetical protein VD929_09075 [Caulobacteraceae bacterium]|nr:hypothetical protein [Caulobacteraceae bacterium]
MLALPTTLILALASSAAGPDTAVRTEVPAAQSGWTGRPACPSPGLVPAGKRTGATVRKLADLPPADLHRTVLRSRGGCLDMTPDVRNVERAVRRR